MTTTKVDAEKNLREFLGRHGKDGFLRLLLTNYLFELAMYYLHSDKNPPAVKEDTGYRFYVDGRERVYKPEAIERFKLDLRKECEKKALLIIENLKTMQVIEKLDADFMTDPKVTELVGKAFESLTQKT
jgi:hypothetical protein